VTGISADVPDRSTALDDGDPAGVVAVPGTGRQEDFVSMGGQELGLAYDASLGEETRRFG
jgi:hypothetical protein